MGIRQTMLGEFGERALKRPATCGELYDAVDAITEAFTTLKKRVEDLESAPVRYRGTWQRSDEYRRGSVVTYGGSAWHAIKDTQPGDAPGASNLWQLMVKAGKNGKDASR